MSILDHTEELVVSRVELKAMRNENFALKCALNNIIDEANHWLQKNQSNYIEIQRFNQPYVSGRCLTDLRAHLEQWIINYKPKEEL